MAHRAIRNSLPRRGANKKLGHQNETYEPHERDSGRSSLPLTTIPLFLPRSPVESFEKPLTASAIVRRPSNELRSTNRVARIKSRPPSGIMFAVFRAVKQFLRLLFVFSLEFNRWSKSSKNTAKTAFFGNLRTVIFSSTSRKKVSLSATSIACHI